MFEQRRYRTTTASAIGMLELIHLNIVRNQRAKHKNAVVGFVIDLLQTVGLLMMFLLLIRFLGTRAGIIRGDIVLFMMTGVFLYRAHVKAIGSTFSSAEATDGMLMHAPLNTIVLIISSALSVLYTQILTAATLLYLYHAAVTPITIDDPVGVMAMFLLNWMSGCAIGLFFYSLKPWAPRAVAMVLMIYQRAMLIASGKMFLANAMPGFIVQWFLWNPLFHTIDQARGYTFINYNPHYTSPVYALWVALPLLMIGLLIEFFTRRRVSVSWRTQGV